jgi:hypothetical protein
MQSYSRRRTHARAAGVRGCAAPLVVVINASPRCGMRQRATLCRTRRRDTSTDFSRERRSNENGFCCAAAAQKAILIHNGRPQRQQQPVLDRQPTRAGHRAPPRRAQPSAPTDARRPCTTAATDQAHAARDRRRLDRHATRRRGDDPRTHTDRTDRATRRRPPCSTLHVVAGDPADRGAHPAACTLATPREQRPPHSKRSLRNEVGWTSARSNVNAFCCTATD